MNTSKDPYYVPDHNQYRLRMPHRELEKRSPLELQKIHQASKLYKPFISATHRTFEAQEVMKQKEAIMDEGAHHNNRTQRNRKLDLVEAERDSLYMFGGINEHSMNSISYQNVEGDDEEPDGYDFASADGIKIFDN